MSEIEQSLRRENAELRSEVAALRSALGGNMPHAISWLQTKVWRQAAALNALQRKGRGHTHTERAEMATTATPV